MPPEPRHHEDLRRMAEDTLNIIKRDGYNVKNTAYKLHTEELERSTKAYPPRAYDHWKSPPSYQSAHNHGGPYINIVEVSTLACARNLLRTLRNNSRGSSRGSFKIGVLNFASATKPGGGFKNGAEAQEESIARVSNLYQSLCTREAREHFYDMHSLEDPFYSHSMIYSPNVEVIKDDEGTPTRPMQIDVLTCAAVNAHRLRQSEFVQQHGRHTAEKEIEAVMKERMGRILCLFEVKGVRNLVLGSFGTGVFRNDVNVVARLWAELLSVPGARFSGSFDRANYITTSDTWHQQASTAWLKIRKARYIGYVPCQLYWANEKHTLHAASDLPNPRGIDSLDQDQKGTLHQATKASDLLNFPRTVASVLNDFLMSVAGPIKKFFRG